MRVSKRVVRGLQNVGKARQLTSWEGRSLAQANSSESNWKYRFGLKAVEASSKPDIVVMGLLRLPERSHYDNQAVAESVLEG